MRDLAQYRLHKYGTRHWTFIVYRMHNQKEPVHPNKAQINVAHIDIHFKFLNKCFSACTEQTQCACDSLTRRKKYNERASVRTHQHPLMLCTDHMKLNNVCYVCYPSATIWRFNELKLYVTAFCDGRDLFFFVSRPKRAWS